MNRCSHYHYVTTVKLRLVEPVIANLESFDHRDRSAAKEIDMTACFREFTNIRIRGVGVRVRHVRRIYDLAQNPNTPV